MTLRAVIIGLVASGLIGAIGFVNDLVMHQTFLFGSYIPIFVYGILILFVVLVNPVLFKASPRAGFSGRELALIIAMCLPACYVSGRTLIHHFTACLMTPRHYSITNPAWQKHELMRKVPPVMMAGVRPALVDGDVVDPCGLCQRLVATDEAGASSPERAVRAALPDEDREAISRALAESDPAHRAGRCRDAVIAALNRVLPRKDLFAPSDFTKVILPAATEHLLRTGPWNAEEVRRLNRHLIDATFPKKVQSLVEREEFVVSAFQQGLAVGNAWIGWGEVPWYAWGRTMWFWLPLIIAFGVAFIGLALVATRQFHEHEHLPFPIVTFAQSLLPEEGSVISSVLKSALFWVAAGLVALIHVNNYAQKYWPEHLVWIPTWFDFRSLRELPLFETIARGNDHGILHFNIYATCIGFAYFIASDVALSVGLAPLCYALVAGTLAGYGVSLHTGGRNTPSPDQFLKAGAFFGMFLIILYTGRRHYAAVFRRGVGLRSPDEVRTAEVWGARVFLVSSLVAVLLLWYVGVRPQWALFFVAGTIVVYAASSRVVAEAGSFLLQPHVYPTVLLWGFVGARVLGTQQLLPLFLAGAIFSIGTHVAVMPMMMHGLRLSQERPGRTAALGAAGLVIALLVAVPIALYFQYNEGSGTASDGWTRWVPRYAFDPIVSIENKLEAQGVLAEAGRYSGLAWFGALRPYWPAVLAFVVSLGLVLATEFARLRWAKWPIHPVIFICAGWWHSRVLAMSFLLGWLVKVVVNKYGGAPTYRKLKPLMVGLIAGDMLGGIIITIIATIYYLAGNAPLRHWVLPG